MVDNPLLQSRPGLGYLTESAAVASVNGLTLCLFARTLFNAPSHFAKASSSGAQHLYILSSKMSWRQNCLLLETGSISAASITEDIENNLTVEYSCSFL